MYLYLYSGVTEEPKLPVDGSELRKPKQTKLPGPAYADTPLGRDGQRENPLEAESWEEASSGSPAAGTPQVTPSSSLSRPPWKRTESALYSCTVLLASVALGLDLRELPRAQAAEEPWLREERRKREGLLQRGSRPRAADRPWPPPTGEGPRGPASLPSPGTLGLLSRPSLSTRCLLQTEGTDSFEGSSHGALDPDAPPAEVRPASGRGCPQPSSAPRRESDDCVWRAPCPPSSEQTRGNTPPWASSKERAVRHRRTVSDGSAAQAPGGSPCGQRCGRHCARGTPPSSLGV